MPISKFKATCLAVLELVATAKAYELKLVTADERLMRPVPGLRVLANR